MDPIEKERRALRSGVLNGLIFVTPFWLILAVAVWVVTR